MLVIRPLRSISWEQSSVIVFTCVIIGGWLWGAWGLLLAVPVVMIIKSICDRVEDLKPVGELLGD